MPTPFYHLILAQEVLRDVSLKDSVREMLLAERAAFMFGNTAPDVQTVSGQTREQTHFFSIPEADRGSAQQMMFSEYPELAHAQSLSVQQAAFIAGYCTHLLLDQTWIWEVFHPYFGIRARWGDLSERLFLHNVLRAHLDRRDYARLPIDMGEVLLKTLPRVWLPFVQIDYLNRWRGFLAEQCGHGGTALTVQVFAERMGRQPEEFEALMSSDDAIQSQILSRMRPYALETFRHGALVRSIEMINGYLAPDIEGV